LRRHYPFSSGFNHSELFTSTPDLISFAESAPTKLSSLTPTLPLPHHRKWFLSTLSHADLNNLLAAYSDKSAEAICTFAFSAGPGQEPLIFQGRTVGKIVPARGPGTFGKGSFRW
jgi:Ham1 family